MAKQRRKPTYGAATRLARLLVLLYANPLGLSFEQIERDLGVSHRTVLRYLAAARSGLVDWKRQPLLEIVSHDVRRIVRLSSHAGTPDSSAYEAAALFFALTLLRFLEGTVLKENVSRLWENVRRSLRPHQTARLQELERKFYSVDYAPKDYRKYADHLDVILRALMDQNRLVIRYAALGAEPRQHTFEPYTLLAYRGGLYLLGRSDLAKSLMYLAVERIQGVEFANGVARRKAEFAYPRDYDPAKYTEGVFGIVEGEKTRVELAILNEETERLLRSRTIHPTQQFRRGRKGRTTLSMTVRGTTELRNWILSFGPWLKVLKPAKLREEVSELVTEAASLYRSRSARQRSSRRLE
jgi:proteasome accessory factor B